MLPSSPLRQAFVLGAGLGTRLRRLTEVRPKPLIPVAGRPLITYAFEHLRKAGIERIVVNTHHRAECYARMFPDAQYHGVPLAFRHEPLLLETGGGIKNVEDLLGGGPLIVYNGDILSTIPIEKAIQHHFEAGNEVTLILRSHGGPLHIAHDVSSGRILDISNRLGRAEGTYLFTGIYIVQPSFFNRLRLQKVSVVPTFLEMIEAGGPLGGIVLDEGDWWDLGTREQYLDVHRTLKGRAPTSNWVSETSYVAPDARISGASYVGANCKIGAGCVIEDSILWEGTELAENSVLRNCIVTEGQTVSGSFTNQDF